MASVDDLPLTLTTAPGNINYSLLEGYPKIKEDAEKVYATEVYVMEVADLEDFFDESFPQPVLDINDFPTRVKRRVMPGAAWLATVSVAAEPFIPTQVMDPYRVQGASITQNAGYTGQAWAKYVRVTIEYESVLNPDTDSFLEKSVSASGEFLYIPPQNVALSTTAPSANVAMGEANSDEGPNTANKDQQLAAYKRISTIEWDFKWNGVRLKGNTMWNRFIAALGKVNEVRSELFKGAYPQSVLFTGLSGTQSFRYYKGESIGEAWNMNFKFSQRRILDADGSTYGWNHVYSPAQGAWRLIRRNGIAGPTLYELADLDGLFKPVA